MDFLQQLNWRYATKSFDPTRKVSEEAFEGLLEALRLSPSSFGLQPWGFVVVTDAAVREKLRAVAWNQPQITEASHLIVLCRKDPLGQAEIDHFIARTAAERGQDVSELEGYKKMIEGSVMSSSEDQRAVWSSKQVYLALGVLLSACALNGIDAAPMEGFDPAQFDQILDLPSKGLRSVVLCPVGYRAETDKYASAKKVRYSKEEVVVRL